MFLSVLHRDSQNNWRKISLIGIFFVTLQSNCELLIKKLIVMSEIADRVKAIVVEKLGVDADKVTPEASFR